VTDPGERLVRDVHPAEVALDGHVLTAVRVFVTTGRLLALQVQAGKITPVLDEPVSEPVSVPASRSSLHGSLEVRLADGRTAWVNRGAGCGCGSALRTIAPPVSW
jgi:hypothetical protein